MLMNREGRYGGIGIARKCLADSSDDVHDAMDILVQDSRDHFANLGTRSLPFGIIVGLAKCDGDEDIRMNG